MNKYDIIINKCQGVGSLVNIKEKLIYDKLKYAPEIIQINESSQKNLVGSEQ